MRISFLRGLAACVSLSGIAVPQLAAAAEQHDQTTVSKDPESTGTSWPGARPESDALLATELTVHSESPAVNAESLRGAIAKELGTEVRVHEPATASERVQNVVVTYHPSTKELAVTFMHPRRGVVTRVVEAPAAAEDVISVAALLVGNLARQPVESTTAPRPSEPGHQTLQHSAPPTRQPSAATAAVPQPVVESTPPHAIAVASFFHPLSTNHDSPNVYTHLNFNLLYGQVGVIEGFQLGLANAVSDRADGLQIGVLGSWVIGDFNGLALAGAFNSSRRLTGLQLALGVNHVQESRVGGQVSLLLNMTGGHASGVAATMGVNWARSSEGFSAAGIANLGQGRFTGLEIAPLNLAADVTGVQVGVVNIGRHVTGIQLGLINIADDIEGVPIGLISVTRTGGVHPQVFTSTAAVGNVGIKFATRYTYTMLSVSARSVHDHLRLGPGLTMGASVPLLPHSFFEPDLGVTHLLGSTDCCTTGFFGARERQSDETQMKLRGALRYQFDKHLSIFAGLGAVGRLTYGLDGFGNTKYPVEGLVEGFGGVEL